MICKNCKAQIKPSQKFCPKCGMEIKQKRKLSKKAQAFIACVCCLVLIITGTIGGLYFYQNNHAVDDPDSNYIALESGFTDIKVTDEKTALEAIASVADVIGIENVENELKISNTNTIDNNTYYRFQQYYNDIPVYGSSISLVSDNNKDVVALTSNYLSNVKVDINKKTKSDSQIQKAIKKFLHKKISNDINIYSISEINESSRIIYNMDKPFSALSISVITDYGAYNLIIDAVRGKVVFCTDEINYVQKEFKINGQNGEQSFTAETDGKTNTMKYISNSGTEITVSTPKNKNKFDWYYPDNSDIVTWKKDNKVNKSAVDMMTNITNIYYYYLNSFQRDSLDDNKIPLRLYVNTEGYKSYDGEDIPEKNNAYFWVSPNGPILASTKNIENGKEIAELSANLDVLAHEYTHGVIHYTCALRDTQYNSFPGAINEGISDIFGVLAEQSIADWSEPDWLMSEDVRNIKDPHRNSTKHPYPKNIEELSNSKTYSDKGVIRYYIDDEENESSDFCHFACSIISHSAYLMWNGLNGNPNKKIESSLLGELWYTTLYLMQSDATFSQCRNAVELSARIMLKDGKLTQEQYQCVLESFDEVGIENAPYTYYYLVKNDFNLKVLNSKETEDVNFNLKISKPSETELMGAPELVLEENSLYGNKQISLDDGVYYLEITDLDENAQNSVPIKTKIIVDGDDENAADEVTVRTDFSNIITVEIPNDSGKYEDIYYKYINDTIIPSQEYCGEYNESFSNVPESELYSKIKDLKGISSAYIKDLNKDGIPEMFTVSTLGKGSAKGTDYYEDSIVVDIHCYSLDKSNSVVDCGSIYGIGTFKNADEQVYVYFADSSQPRICVSNNYWTFVSTASTFGQSFKAFAFDKKVQEKESVLYHFSKGNESYTINGENVNIDNANRKASSVFKSLDLTGISIESGWNKFPKNCKKICTLGTKYSGNDSYEAFIEDYTELAKHINIDATNNTDGERKSETTTQVSTISSDPGKFYGNDTAEQLRKSIIGSWGALGSMVPEYNFFADGNASGDMPWTASGTYSISDDKRLTIKWVGKSEKEEYVWSEESWDDFYSHHEYGTDFWCITDDGILKINGKEKYRDGVDNFTYNSDGDLMAIISGTWISDKGYKEYQINSDGTWVESTVVVSDETLINRTKLDNGKVEIIDDTTAKLWQEVDSLSQIPGASELIYDSKNDKISIGGTNNTFTRAKYK